MGELLVRRKGTLQRGCGIKEIIIPKLITMLTDRFHRLRKQELDLVFTKKEIGNVWRKNVKDQLRKLAIKDIYDYYDFNYNIDSRAEIIRNDLLNGNYKVSKPLIYRIEKKFGICRHLIIPQPVDALVLQIITIKISKEILSNQPSENSYYSHTKHNVKKPHEIDEYGFYWRELWQKMQKKIYKFNQEKRLIVVTDLSNYYDSIYIPELRKIITSYVNGGEVLLDILFKIIESITWLPDYLPYFGRGLPTCNFEGVRLLAHSLLFELDIILKEKSNDSFTRWMDDIVIGVDSRNEAIEILSSASDVLKSRGLALNLKKTNIYDAEEAEFHFLIEENQYLDSIDYEYHLKSGILQISKELSQRFNRHLKHNGNAKYFEKVSKRYITAFRKLKSKRILSQIPQLFNENPSIRQDLIYYLAELGFDSRTNEIVLKILEELKLYDDISLFNICNLITDWQIPVNPIGEQFLDDMKAQIESFSKRRKNPFDFYCILWVRTKYDSPEDLYNFLRKYENIWKTHPFLRRQATAILGRLVYFKRKDVNELLSQQIATSESQVVSVATSIQQFSSSDKIESKVNMYLFPPKAKPKIYPLQKFLILCTFLNSEKYLKNQNVKEKIDEYINDPFYKKWIQQIYETKSAELTVV